MVNYTEQSGESNNRYDGGLKRNNTREPGVAQSRLRHLKYGRIMAKFNNAGVKKRSATPAVCLPTTNVARFVHCIPKLQYMHETKL